jgi:hypothetical protein
MTEDEDPVEGDSSDTITAEEEAACEEDLETSETEFESACGLSALFEELGPDDGRTVLLIEAEAASVEDETLDCDSNEMTGKASRGESGNDAEAKARTTPEVASHTSHSLSTCDLDV